MPATRRLSAHLVNRQEPSSPQASTAIRVLVIEDDEDLRDTLCRYLGAIGIDVHGLPSAKGLDDQLARSPVDLIVCDVNLPGESGFSILARLRLATQAGIIMLTARGLEEDRLLGLSLGADGYLVKPVNLRELEFTIRNLHRRITNTGAVTPPPEETSADSWIFNPALWTLAAPNGKTVQLSMAESRLVNRLMTRVGEIVSRDALLEAMGRPNLESYSRNLDVTVSRLRKKVEGTCEIKMPINSARGTGYIFNGRGKIEI